MKTKITFILLGMCAAGLMTCGNDNDYDTIADNAVVDTGGDTSSNTDPEVDTDADTGSEQADTGSEQDEDTDYFDKGFRRTIVSNAVEGAAYATVADVNADGHLDLVVSAFGAPRGAEISSGSVILYKSDGTLNGWTPEIIAGPEQELKFPNLPTVADLDGDGDQDVIVPAGFFPCLFVGGPCGALVWFEQDGDEWLRHDIIPNGSNLFYHYAALVDLNGDGIDDIVTVGEERKSVDGKWIDTAYTQLIKGTTNTSRFEKNVEEMSPGLGALPTVHDVDGDGRLDVASAEYFTPEEHKSFAWLEQTATPTPKNPAGKWARHVIADDVGPSIQFSFIPDLLGDGKLYGVGSNHTCEPKDGIESAVYLFEVPKNPKLSVWPKRKISEGIMSRQNVGMMAPGVFGWGDVDGDGDIDITLSGDGDPRIFLLLQDDQGQFETRVLQQNAGQAGGQKIVDLDQDGLNEIVVTSYERNAVYIYEWID
jgi:hypothetical protein